MSANDFPMIQEITKYKTTDGQEWESRAKAEEWQATLALASLLENDSELYFQGSSALDVARWFMSRYIPVLK
jgi:hypothetical protein